MNKKIGFIGGGNMAYAIAKGLVTGEVVSPGNIIVSARTSARLDTVWKDLGVNTTLDNLRVAKEADVVFLGVKPHLICPVLNVEGMTDALQRKLVISVAAGITIDTMREILVDSRIVRTMPNTPCLVQCGTVVFSCCCRCSSQDKELVNKLFAKIGMIEEVEEQQIDAMAALMGCSVAWYYMVVEAMSDGGVMNGVPRQLAYRLAAKSMEGAAKMVLETGKHPGQLKDEVTSPGGSTICGVNELEAAGVRGNFMRAVSSATQKNRELGANK